MNDYIYVIIIVTILFFCIICMSNGIESFTNTNIINPDISYNKYKQIKKINYSIKDDVYINFLGETNALKDAFKKVPEKYIDKESELFDKNTPILKYHGENRVCEAKSSHLCEMTNPMLYINQNPYFPPRWIFTPYKNITLPKHIDLKCWKNMNNYCNNYL